MYQTVTTTKPAPASLYPAAASASISSSSSRRTNNLKGDEDKNSRHPNHNHKKDGNGNTVVGPSFPQHLTPGFVLSHVVSGIILALCIKTCVWDFHNVETALAFYGVYHREPLNQVIHFVGVPAILWTMLIATAHLVLPGNLVINVLPGIPPHSCSMATLWALLYTVFYPSIDFVGFLLYAPFLYFFYATAIRWTAQDQATAALTLKEQKRQHGGDDKSSSIIPSWTGTGKLISWACFWHFVGWYIQIHPGHKIIEGASPAVMANIGGALVAAPLFAFYEGVWLVGLRPELYATIQAKIAEYTAELCSQGAAMRVCETLLSQS